MKIEICDNTFVAVIIICVALVVAAAIWFPMYFSTEKAKAAFRAGLEEVQPYSENNCKTPSGTYYGHK